MSIFRGLVHFRRGRFDAVRFRPERKWSVDQWCVNSRSIDMSGSYGAHFFEYRIKHFL